MFEEDDVILPKTLCVINLIFVGFLLFFSIRLSFQRGNL